MIIRHIKRSHTEAFVHRDKIRIEQDLLLEVMQVRRQ